MADEVTAYSQVLVMLAREIVAQLAGLSDEELNHLVPLTAANTLAALTTHRERCEQKAKS